MPTLGSLFAALTASQHGDIACSHRGPQIKGAVLIQSILASLFCLFHVGICFSVQATGFLTLKPT